MELQILHSALESREHYELYRQHLNPKRWSREFQIIFGYVDDYYKRDKEAQSVDRTVLEEIITNSIQNKKHVDKFVAYVNEAWGQEASTANVQEAVLAARRSEVAIELATAIVNGKDHAKILEEYNQLLLKESLEEDSNIETYTVSDMANILTDDADRSNIVPIFPRALAERLDGGLEGSDHLILIARPEMGKTALILTIACGMARAGIQVVVFNNEERIRRLYARAISCITGLTIHEIRADRERAMALAMERGFGNIIFKSMSPGSPAQIDRELEKYPEAKAFIVDQLRNLVVKADNKTNQLEEAAKGIRNIAKARDLVAISVTQAGDSAEGKSVLGMGDVDSSNTGIPGACDILLGVGANEQQKAEGIRILTLIKNKTTGDHDSFPTRVNPMISKYVSV